MIRDITQALLILILQNVYNCHCFLQRPHYHRHSTRHTTQGDAYKAYCLPNDAIAYSTTHQPQGYISSVHCTLEYSHSNSHYLLNFVAHYQAYHQACRYQYQTLITNKLCHTASPTLLTLVGFKLLSFLRCNDSGRNIFNQTPLQLYCWALNDSEDAIIHRLDFAASWQDIFGAFPMHYSPHRPELAYLTRHIQ